MTNTKSIIFIIIGVFSAGFGLKGFLLPQGFIDGGAMGIALLLEKITGIHIGILIVLVNAPFIYLGKKILSTTFTIKTILAVAALSIVVSIVPYPAVTDDKLLIAVFGGFFLGSGIGLAMKGGCVIDGTEVLALYLSKRSPLNIGEVIGGLNIIIFLFGALLLNIEIALYAILTYLSASKTVNFVIHGIDQYLDLTIISDKSEEIRIMIINKLGKGVTIISGKKGMRNSEGEETGLDILYTVTTKLEVMKLKNEINKIDPHAFIVQNRIDETTGGFLKKHLNHH